MLSIGHEGISLKKIERGKKWRKEGGTERRPTKLREKEKDWKEENKKEVQWEGGDVNEVDANYWKGSKTELREVQRRKKEREEKTSEGEKEAQGENSDENEVQRKGWKEEKKVLIEGDWKEGKILKRKKVKTETGDKRRRMEKKNESKELKT